jgi:predicted MFS family arabinose efflux permease
MISFALSAWSSRANSYFVLYLESIKDGAGNRKYSTYQVNILPLGGYALQIVTSLALNWLSDYAHWRWQIAVASSIASAIVLAVLSCWPSNDTTILTFYFLTYATNAGNPSLMAWLAELLRAEPEARAVIVAMTVTLVYVGHAAIPLGAWRVADAPRYPVGFPMAAGMAGGSVFALLALLWWARRHAEIAERGYGGVRLQEEGCDDDDDGGRRGVEVGKGGSRVVGSEEAVASGSRRG